MRYARLLAVGLLAAALASCSQPRPIPLGANTNDYGLLAEGEKFGVAIGAARLSARRTLDREGYDFGGSTTCDESGIQDVIDCAPGDTFDVFHYRARVMQRRIVFLEIEDEFVTKIGWSFVAIYVDS